eukprot:superscaffoldBa00001198_g9459
MEEKVGDGGALFALGVAVCVRLWLRPQRHWRGRVNRPVRSPRISVGLECAMALALALAGDTTLGVEGRREGGAKQDACEAAGSLESSHPAMPAQKTCRREGGEVAKDTLRQKSTARDRTLTFRRP